MQGGNVPDSPSERIAPKPAAPDNKRPVTGRIQYGNRNRGTRPNGRKHGAQAGAQRRAGRGIRRQSRGARGCRKEKGITTCAGLKELVAALSAPRVIWIMKAGLLQSQFAALEEPEGALVTDIADEPARIAARLAGTLGLIPVIPGP